MATSTPSKRNAVVIADTVTVSGNVSATDLTLSGNLTVSGTTTTLNTATLQVQDKNIVLNYGTGDTSGSADGAGITIQDAVSSTTDATILWGASDDRFNFSHMVNIETGGLRSTGSTSDGNAYSGIFRKGDGSNTLLIRNDGVVIVPSNYFYVTSTQGAYIEADLRVRGSLLNDTSGEALKIADNTHITGTVYLGSTATANDQLATNSGTDIFLGTSSKGLRTYKDLHTNSGNNKYWHAGNDGASSGLDADLLDGQHGSSFWRSDTSNNGAIRFNTTEYDFTSTYNPSQQGVPMSIRLWDHYTQTNAPATYGQLLDLYGRSGHWRHQFHMLGTDLQFRYGTYPLATAGWSSWYTQWHSGNDGASSGLDADLLDGQHGSYYRNASNINAGTLPEARIPTISKYLRSDTTDTATGKITFQHNDGIRVSTNGSNPDATTGTYEQGITIAGGNMRLNIDVSSTTNGGSYLQTRHNSSTYPNAYYPLKLNPLGGGVTIAGNTAWHAGNDGSGSGLDADTLDSHQASSFLRSDTNDTYTGTLSLAGNIKDNGDSRSIRLMHGTTNSQPSIGVGEQGTYGMKMRWDSSQSIEFDGFWSTSVTGSRNRDLGDINVNTAIWSFPTGVKINGSTAWHAGNDGTGSGLDADLLDGQHGSYYLNYNNFNNTPSIPSVGNGTMTISAGTSLSGGGSFTANQSGNSTVTINVAEPANTDANWRDVVAWNGQLVKDTAVELHGSGYLRASYLNMTHGVGTRSSDTVFYSSTDDYIRKTNAAGMRASLSLYTTSEVDALIPTIPSNNVVEGGTSYNGEYPMVARTSANTIYSHNGIKFNGAQEKLTVGGSVVINGSTSWHAGNDGSGSGLDADTVDGVQASQIIYGNSSTGTSEGTFTNWNSINKSGFYSDDGASNKWSTSNWSSVLHHRLYSSNNNYATQLGFDTYNNNLYTRTNNNGTWTSWDKIWHAGNDGSGSGLDADTLDGINSGSFLRSDAADTASGNLTFTGNITQTGGTFLSHGAQVSNLTTAWQAAGTSKDRGLYPFRFQNGATGQPESGDNAHWGLNIYAHAGSSGNYPYGTQLSAGSTQNLWHRWWANGSAQSWRKIWDTANDGSGSGLDADTLDGQHGSYYYSSANPPPTYTKYLRSDVHDTGVGLTINGGTLQQPNDATLYLTAGNNNDWGLKIGATSGKTEYGQVIEMPASFSYAFRVLKNGSEHFNINSTGATIGGNYIWHAGNDGSGSGLDADLLDSKHLSQIVPYHSGSDFANGTLITTSISASSTNGASFVIEITGKSSSSSVSPHSMIAQGYLYNNTIIAVSGTNITGNSFTYIKAMNNNGYLSFWFPRHAYWNSYSVIVRDAGGNSDNKVTAIANSSDPSGATKKVTINLAKTWNSGNDGTGSGLDADTVDGQHETVFMRKSANSHLDMNGYNINDLDLVETQSENKDVKFSVWGGTTFGIGMTSGVTLGHLNDYAMTFCMNNDSDRGFWWGYSGQGKGSGAMSLTTGGKLWVTSDISTPYTELNNYTSGNIAVGKLTLKGGGKTGWGPGDEHGSIDFYNSDGSGVGARNAARIVAENNSGNGSSTTTFEGEIAFYTSAYNAQLNSDPALRLEGDNIARFYNDIRVPNGTAASPSYTFAADTDSGMFSLGSNAVGFGTGGTQRFKINSNGLLLTGTSSLYVNGQETITNSRNIQNVVNITNTDGYIEYKRTGAAPAIFNRLGTTGASGTSRGEIVNFKSASTKVGRIGYAQPYGGIIYLAGGQTTSYGVGVYQFSTTSYFQPCTYAGANLDDVMTCGGSGARWTDVYSTNGTIQTSDRNEKQDIQELTDAETRVATVCKGLIRRYRWISSVEEKGDNARYHFGAIAQDVEDAFTAEGLNAGDYALFIKNTWWDYEGDSFPTAEAAPTGAVEKTRLGIRYNQLLAFIISAL